MKKVYYLVLVLSISFISFSFAPKAAKYTVDLTKSSITWEGKKLTGSHQGTLNLKSATLGFNGQKLIEGSFVADMNTIKDSDNNERLTKHLKSDDFFGVEKFPEASFVIKKVVNNNNELQITGDLTVKGKTNSISFPAKLSWNNNDKSVTAFAEKIVIDRTKFGIEYKSKSIFSTLGNNFINDEFTLTIKLIAMK